MSAKETLKLLQYDKFGGMYIKNRRTINKLIWFSLRNQFDLTRLMPMFAIILSFVKSACEFYIYHGQVNCDFGPNGNRNCRIAFNSGSYHSSYGTFVCCIEKKKYSRWNLNFVTLHFQSIEQYPCMTLFLRFLVD